MKRIVILIAAVAAIFGVSCTAEETSSAKKEPLIEIMKLNEPEETVPAVVVTPTIEPIGYTEAASEPIAEPICTPEITYNARLFARIDPEPEPEPEIIDSCYDEDIQYGEYHEDVPAADTGEYLGDWTITFYCCGPCCNGSYTGTASGAPLTPWHTAACTALPFGTRVYIEGVGEFTIEDTGVSGAWIDCCVGSHDEALALGMRTAAVYIVG